MAKLILDLLENTVKSCKEENIQKVLYQDLDYACSEFDSEVLFMMGANIRKNSNVSNFNKIDEYIFTYLSEADDLISIGLVSWFLWTFWIPASEPNEELVAKLINCLSIDLDPVYIHEGIILALSSAFHANSSPDIKRLIKENFLLISKQRNLTLLDQFIIDGIHGVLGLN